MGSFSHAKGGGGGGGTTHFEVVHRSLKFQLKEDAKRIHPIKKKRGGGGGAKGFHLSWGGGGCRTHYFPIL